MESQASIYVVYSDGMRVKRDSGNMRIVYAGVRREECFSEKKMKKDGEKRRAF